MPMRDKIEGPVACRKQEAWQWSEKSQPFH